MRIELLRPSDPNTTWQVTLEGEVAVAFSGPDAEQRAGNCYLELKARLTELQRVEDDGGSAAHSG